KATNNPASIPSALLGSASKTIASLAKAFSYSCSVVMILSHFMILVKFKTVQLCLHLFGYAMNVRLQITSKLADLSPNMLLNTTKSFQIKHQLFFFPA